MTGLQVRAVQTKQRKILELFLTVPHETLRDSYTRVMTRYWQRGVTDGNTRLAVALGTRLMPLSRSYIQRRNIEDNTYEDPFADNGHKDKEKDKDKDKDKDDSDDEEPPQPSSPAPAQRREVRIDVGSTPAIGVHALRSGACALLPLHALARVSCELPPTYTHNPPAAVWAFRTSFLTGRASAATSSVKQRRHVSFGGNDVKTSDAPDAPKPKRSIKKSAPRAQT